jgi:hypothetical protein
MNLDIEMYVTVIEYDPLHSSLDIRHAYEASRDANGNSVLDPRPAWSPPIIMHIKDGDLPHQISKMRAKILEVFDKLLDDPVAWDRWTNSYFYFDEEGFQRDILQRIGKYYNRNLKEHAILKTALSLLFFEFLLMVKFTIPLQALPHLEANLDSPKPCKPFGYVIPDTINSFLKAIILPMAEDAAKKLTEYLHDELFKLAVTPKLATTARNDVVLCLLLLLKIFISNTQATLFLLVTSPSEEIDMEYTETNARQSTRKMESVADYFVSLHQYTLSRKSCRSPPSSAAIESPFEAHARAVDLKGQLLRGVVVQYGKLDHGSDLWLCADAATAHERPVDLRLGELNQKFKYTNVRRQCWRILLNMKDSGSR